MNKLFLFSAISLLFFSCQKEHLSTNDLPQDQSVDIANFIKKAQATLRSKMSTSAYSSLNWNNISRNELTLKNPVLKVASSLEKRRFLYYSVCNNEEVYNWVTFDLKKNNGSISGTITLRGMANELLKTLVIDKNKIQVPLSSNYGTDEEDPEPSVIDLDEVIVYGYYQNTYFELISLYWLFEGNFEFNNLYTVLDPSILDLLYNMGYSGGIGDPITLVTVESVTNLLSQECLNNAFNAITAEKLKAALNKLYQQTFVGINKVHNLRIQEASSIQDPFGQEVPARSDRDPNDPSIWVIELNNGFNHQFTQELWGSIIAHELVHGFIQMNELEFSPTSDFSGSHQIMLDKWILQLQELLIESFNMPAIDALGLSLQGFDDVLRDKVSGQFKQDMKDWINSTYSITLDEANQIQDTYIDQTKGTKCN